MEEQKDLPKPQTDLPLPEKELPSHGSPRLQGDALEPQTRQSIFRNKVFILFIILSFLVAFLIGGFILGRNSVLKALNPTAPSIPPPDPVFYEGTPTPEATESADNSNWKTYENSTYGFSVKYPGNWIIREDTNPEGMVAGAKETLTLEITSSEFGTGTWVEIAPGSNTHSTQGEFDFSESPVKNITIGGIPAKRQETPFVAIGGIDLPEKGWKPAEKKRWNQFGIQITIRNGDKDAKNLATAEEIVSSIQFTN